MPTKEALVNLTEQPPFVCSFELVDHVHLQRCSFKSKHFDMLVFWKDWDRYVCLSVLTFISFQVHLYSVNCDDHRAFSRPCRVGPRLKWS